MEDDEGYENFDVNQADIDNALNPGRRFFQSKEQATYGIWADEDSDNEDKRPTLSRRKQANYSAPVNFVSGGIKIGEKIVNENNEEKESVTETSSYAEMNFSFKTSTAKSKKQTGANVFAGMRTSTSKGIPDPTQFGDWASKSGKGNAIRSMMEKMGYKWGEGLGKEGKGIVEPVQAQLRQGRGAVGAYGKEATGPKFGESAAEAQKRIASESGVSHEDIEGEPVPKRSWRKADKTKTKYKTIDDVIQEGGNIPAKIAKNNVKVIDMTGPEQRVYTGYDSFTLKTRIDIEEDGRPNFDIKELRHNLNLLMDMTEQNIRRSNDQKRTLKDQSTALEYDIVQLRQLYATEVKESKRMEEVYCLIEKFKTTGDSMEEIQELFLKLRSTYPNEYRLYNLESVAIPIVLPLIQKHFAKWEPLKGGNAAYGIEVIKEWKEILQDKEKPIFAANIHSLEQISAYERLLWEGWLPTIRKTALAWDPQQQLEEMLQVVENWLPVIPEWMKENILEQIIIPRITERVALWDPLTDVVPIHAWIIPWLHVLGDRLHSVLSQIRQKLAKVIRDKWNPSDVSAIAILKPWVDVWSQSTMSAFLGQHIIPKIERFLENIIIDPINFRKEEWNAIMGWIELINPEIIANSLTRFFFPRWYAVLCTWLDAPNVKLEEVKNWLISWKEERIPAVIANFPTIQENLRRGLIAMAQAASGTRQRGAPIMMPQPMPAAAIPPPPIRDLRAPQQQLSLKDVVEMSAARYNLTYVPQKDRLKDGRQVFWFGSVSIYLDRGMVFCMDPQEFTWRPVSMDELLPLAGAVI